LSGKTDQIAVYIVGMWEYYVPKVGWLAYIKDEAVYRFTRRPGGALGHHFEGYAHGRQIKGSA
jgi:hypothetical protein